jgi:hypothetical protein
MEDTTIRNKTNNTNEKEKIYNRTTRTPLLLTTEGELKSYMQHWANKNQEKKKQTNFLFLLLYRHKNTHVAEAFQGI